MNPLDPTGLQTLAVKAAAFMIYSALLSGFSFYSGCSHKEKEYDAAAAEAKKKIAVQELRDAQKGTEIARGLKIKQEADLVNTQGLLADFQKHKGLLFRANTENNNLKIQLGEQPTQVVVTKEKEIDLEKACENLTPHFGEYYIKLYDSSFGSGNLEIRAGADGGATEVPVDQAFEETIVQNNAKCGVIRDQLRALQADIRSKQSIFKE